MKKTLLLLALFTVLVTGCVQKEIPADDVMEDSSVIEEQLPREQEVLSSQETAEIYLSQKELWQYDGDHIPMMGYSYCLLDLDFDGVCELIRNVNAGSGRFSYNEYYRINSDSRKVEIIPADDMENGNGYDYGRFEDEIRLLSGVSDNLRFFFCKNYTRISTGVYTLDYGKMYLAPDGIHTEILFGEYHDERDEANQEHLYNVKENGNFRDVDKQTYDDCMTSFLAENYDSDMKWSCIDGAEFDSADGDTQKQMLTDACEKFTCVLFFYD